MHLSIPGLSGKLNEQPILVASSAVLAAVASQQFARSELKRGSLSWRRPAIYSLDAWLTACWQEARYASGDLPSLLSPSQELLLWERAIAESAADLFDVPATARLARDAFRLSVEWRIPQSDERWSLHEDARQFQRWHATFRKHCQSNGWMTGSDAVRRVPDWIKSVLCRTESVIFAGFDQPSPCVADLIAAAGVHLPFGAAIFKERPGRIRMYSDLRAQIVGAARWARERIETDATLSLGIFIPGLAEFRSQIERAFQSVFYPASGLRYVAGNPAMAEGSSIFHINRAQSLNEHPLVANALLLLELAQPRIESAAATAILRSPFIRGASAERGMRAMADLRLRRLREMDLSLGDLESATRGCPLLTETWRRVREVLRSRPQQADAGAWSKFFGDLAQAAGWPGDVELSAAEQQVMEGWKDSLSSLASLGLVSPALAFDAALTRLRQILGAGGVQTGDWYSPIQILDAADAPGLRFDASFAVGLSEETWPPALRIAPIIPLELQRAHGVPRSSPASMQEERVRLTEELFSTSDKVAGGFSDRLSPLAARHCRVVLESEVPEWKGKTPSESFSPATLDETDDSKAPPFDLTRDARGGTGIIKSQSQCGFRAFAEYRLGSQAPEDSCFGFDARDRGGFLHKALQLMWAELKDSDTLRDYADAALRELIRESVAKAVNANPDSLFHGQTTLVERERLENLLWEWLNDVEKQRKQPFAVEQIESELRYELAGLPLRLRVDRIDRLEKGGLLLIDYKSGKVTKNKLDCPRPSEPQLLVYAAAKGENVEGLLFGQVRARECRLVGKTRERQMGGNSTAVLGSEWEDFTLEAAETVRALAAEFVAGHALIDPLKDACDFCGNAPLCRINEMPGEADQDA